MPAVTRSTEKSLNAAFQTADVKIICAAIAAVIKTREDITALAKKAGVDRSTIYRAFKSSNGPKLDCVLKVMGALGFQVVVKLGQQPSKSELNRFAPPWKSRAHLELRSDRRLCSAYLTRALKTSELKSIVEAFSDVLRAQENVVQLAEKTIRARSSLYRAFHSSRVPSFSTIVTFLYALGMRLAVKPRSRKDKLQRTSKT